MSHMSIELENSKNSSSYVGDVCVDNFEDAYKLLFIHGRR